MADAEFYKMQLQHIDK